MSTMTAIYADPRLNCPEASVENADPVPPASAGFQQLKRTKPTGSTAGTTDAD
jgi:hypothetical protein